MVVTFSQPLPLTGKPPPLFLPRLRIQPRLSVVIVNYRQWENTAALVRQLRQSQALRHHAAAIQIVDNHSPQHPVARQLRRCPGVTLRRWSRNRGFARAVNEGVRLSEGSPWVLLLNPDMSVPPGFLDRVLQLSADVTENEPGTGIVGLGLRDGDGERQLSAGRFPTLLGTLLRLLLPRERRKYCSVPEQERSTVDWVTGCGLLVRRACWEDLGGLDEAFFLYYEDVDLCRRARAAGWTVRYEPAVQAVHHQPLHQRSISPALRLVTRHSLLTYGKKHWSGWQFQMLAGIVRLEAWGRTLLARLRGRPRESELFTELGALAADLAHQRLQAARRRLGALTRSEPFYEV